MGKRKGLLARKIGMTRIFDETGQAVPVTVLQAGPCFVTQVKNQTKDGYAAIQIGFEHTKRLNRPARGHLGELPPLRHLREIRTDDSSEYSLGQLLDVSLFSVGDRVDVTGTSKGRGFAGAMKRHGFKGGPKTHGQSDRWRAVGSIGSGTTPGHTQKGMRGPGHMGSRRVTVLDLEVVRIEPERNLIAIKGGVPGSKGSLVLLRDTAKGK